MSSWPGPAVCRAWKLREPLADQWKRYNVETRDRALVFWIKAAQVDEWTYAQLGDLVGTLIDCSKEPPKSLERWAFEVAARHLRPPTRRGPKGDVRQDFLTMVEAVIRQVIGGQSARRAYAEMGEEQCRSPKTIEAAVRRGGKWPPGCQL